MNKLIFRFFLVIVVLHTYRGYAQSNFDSVQICHNKENQIRKLSLGKYHAELENGKLISFSSDDGYVHYDEIKRMFVLKHFDNPDSLKIQLTNKGIVFSRKDSSFTVKDVADTNLVVNKVPGGDHEFFQFGTIGFWMFFNNGIISRITCPFSNKALTIVVKEFPNHNLSWDFSVDGSKTDKSNLIMSYGELNAEFLTIDDFSNKIGVRLFSDRQNGVYNWLEGLIVTSIMGSRSDPNYVLRYSKKGIRRQEKTMFNLTCAY
jgi:hypothetical protein